MSEKRIQVELDRIDTLSKSISASMEVLNSSVAKYKLDPQRYKPQLDNALAACAEIRGGIGVINRALDNLKG